MYYGRSAAAPVLEIEVWGFRTAVYVGVHYEKDITGNATTSYYTVGGRRIAQRRAGVVYYLHTDHLGSASLTTDASGNRVGELRYKPYGETRYICPRVNFRPNDATDFHLKGCHLDVGRRSVFSLFKCKSECSSAHSKVVKNRVHNSLRRAAWSVHLPLTDSVAAASTTAANGHGNSRR